MKQDIITLVAKVLNIPCSQVSDKLSYQSIAEWDSLNHVSLMLALEEAFSIHIEGEQVIQLTSVAEIKKYISSLQSDQIETVPTAPTEDQEYTDSFAYHTTTTTAEVHRGLTGVYFDTTTITSIDGQQGTLAYCGYSIEDLTEHATFEEVAYLLLYKQLPKEQQLTQFMKQLQEVQVLPAPVIDLIQSMVQAPPIIVLRTVVSMLAAFDSTRDDTSATSTLHQGIRLLAQLPLIVATHERLRNRQPMLSPKPDLSFVARLLYLLTGTVPSAQVSRIVEKDFILHADHSANASTFTARIVKGTESDLYAAVNAAIATFAGPLHGGAVEQVIKMLQEIGEPEQAAAYVYRQLAQQLPIMGFGHRVYRTEDPRARQMRRIAQELSETCNEYRWIHIADALIEAMEPYARHGIHINVDFYSSIIYHLLNIAHDLSVPMFILSRMAGWLAHILEQQENNILIRPLLLYVGAKPRLYSDFHHGETSCQ